MAKQKYVVRLKTKELLGLKKLIKTGKEKTRTITRARILLFAHRKKNNLYIKEALDVCPTTIIQVKKRYIKSGLSNALHEKPRPGQPSIFNGRKKSKITALACSKAPKGHSQWSLRLLADKAVELKIVDNISHMSIQRTLKKTNLNRISKNNGVLKK